MTEFDMGGAVFPLPTVPDPHQPGEYWEEQQGMTLWDYYAAAALAGMLGADEKRGIGIDAAASYAGLFADAMLAERRKRMEESK